MRIGGDTKVHFIRRGDGSIYAATQNRHLYGETVIDEMTLVASPYWSIQTSPVVDQHLKVLQEQEAKKVRYDREALD